MGAESIMLIVQFVSYIVNYFVDGVSAAEKLKLAIKQQNASIANYIAKNMDIEQAVHNATSAQYSEQIDQEAQNKLKQGNMITAAVASIIVLVTVIILIMILVRTKSK